MELNDTAPLVMTETAAVSSARTETTMAAKPLAYVEGPTAATSLAKTKKKPLYKISLWLIEVTPVTLTFQPGQTESMIHEMNSAVLTAVD